DDLIRRSLTCTMNVPLEQPEKRVFKKEPVQMVLADRGKYLAAVFTIVRHYQTANNPPLGSDAWESYADFVRLVRNPLRYLDLKLDQVRSVDAAREEDPTVLAIRELFDRWPNFWAPGEAAGGYEICEVANERDPGLPEKLRHPEFHDLLKQACSGRH